MSKQPYYKRPLYERPAEEHPLSVQYSHLGQINMTADPGWLVPSAKALHLAGEIGLNQVRDTVERVLSVNWDDYKIDVARQRQAESVRKSRQALLSLLGKEIEDAAAQLDKVRQNILRETAPIEATGNAAVINEMRDVERRQIIRNIDPKTRRDFIASDPDLIRASINSPDRLIDAEALLNIRREYAFRLDPSYQEAEKDAVATYEFIRRRAAEINATSTMLLTKAKIPDPITAEEVYAVFPARSAYEKALQDKRVQHERSKADQEERKRDFEKKNKGISLEAPSSMDAARKEQARRAKQ